MPRSFSILALGGGDEVLPVLTALVPPDGTGEDLPPSPATFRVGGWCGCGPIETELSRYYPRGTPLSAPDWSPPDEELLVVAGFGLHHPQQESHLRDLARDGVPMIVVQPACSAIFGLELDMIQRDTVAPLLPFDATALRPELDWIVQQVVQGSLPLGNLDQIIVERSSPRRDRDTVLRYLAQDALILRKLMGDFHQVGGMQTGEGASLENLSIHVTASGSAIGRWSIGPAADFSGGVLRLIGEAGRWELFMPESGPWKMESSLPLETPTWPVSTAAITRNHVERGLCGETTSLQWEDALRAMDLADVASESVRRGKTLPIRNEIVTEEQTFKGMMAAGGCLIMLLLPLLLVAMSLLDALHIPLSKTVTLSFAPGEYRTYLPADAEKLQSVVAQDSGRPLQPLPSPAMLRASHDPSSPGTPVAYAVMGQDFYVAPTPNQAFALDVRYDGHFSLSHWWLFVLLVPICIFLCLQLLKLAFPAPAAVDESTSLATGHSRHR